jgi:CCR4-NOT transcription complex subunit 1
MFCFTFLCSSIHLLSLVCFFWSYRHTDLCIGSLDDDFDSLLFEIGKEISMADIITELGYGCASDIAHCKEILSLFEPLDDIKISKLLGAIVCTHTGLSEAHNTYSTFLSAFGSNPTIDSSQLTAWNIDVLVDSINETVSIYHRSFHC